MQILLAEPDGSIPDCQTVPERRRPDSFLPAIQEKLLDTEYSASEAQLLIRSELVRLCLEIEVHQENAKAGYILRNIRARFQALRGLANTIQRTEAHQKKEDRLDFDGAKFQYVLTELLKCLDEAIQKTMGRGDPVSAMTVKTTRGILRQIWEKKEPELRREVARMR